MNSTERTNLSKLLSKILRHKAVDEGLELRSDGFISLNTLLSRPKFRKLNATVEKVQQVVQADSKTRFTLRQAANGELLIRANQGHSIPLAELELVEVRDSAECPVVLHGTYLKHWPSIQLEGLKKMGRNHIHLATGRFGDPGVTSGIRKSCDLFIYIDIQKAMSDGITFLRSSNGVILTNGIDGVLLPKYFIKVESTDPNFTYQGTPQTQVSLDALSISDSHLSTIEPRLLFGGAIETAVPSGFLDASDLRQVPDSQEVFLDPKSDTCCLIVELTESVQFNGEQAARTQFEALSEDTDEKKSSIKSITKVNSQHKDMEIWIVEGSQCVAKFNQVHNEQEVQVTLGLIRIAKVTTDVLIAYYRTSAVDAGQGLVANSQQAKEVVKKAVEGFKVVDWNLFPETAIDG